MYKKFGKRIFDIFFSALSLLLLSPLLLVLAILIRLKLGSPVLFSQIRPGKNTKTFKLYKFRSMTEEKDETGVLLPDSLRLTTFGKTLRKTSLDELPELWNILKGEMSFVGPRPLLVEYLPLYTKEQNRRHDTLPGLTGYAQVNGRNAISWEKKFELDCRYVDSLSFVLDIKILLSTAKHVILRSGISSASSDTMEPFKGSQ